MFRPASASCQEESEVLIKYIRTNSEASNTINDGDEKTLKKQQKYKSQENVHQLTLRHLPRETGLLTCPTCLASIEPMVRYQKQPWTYYLSVLLMPFLLCCLPFIFGCMQGKVYYCPYCKMCLGQSDVFEKTKKVSGYTWS